MATFFERLVDNILELIVIVILLVLTSAFIHWWIVVFKLTLIKFPAELDSQEPVRALLDYDFHVPSDNWRMCEKPCFSSPLPAYGAVDLILELNQVVASTAFSFVLYTNFLLAILFGALFFSDVGFEMLTIDTPRFTAVGYLHCQAIDQLAASIVFVDYTLCRDNKTPKLSWDPEIIDEQNTPSIMNTTMPKINIVWKSNKMHASL